jgi:sec-independent protein translocase protein TatC
MALDQEFEQELDETEGKEMSFLDHLEELRWHIIRSVASILVFTIVAWVYASEIFGGIILAPTKSTFWTNRMLCKLADLTGIEGLCFKQVTFVLQNRDRFTFRFSLFFLGNLAIRETRFEIKRS